MGIACDGTIRIRRYLCCCCKRTVWLLPEFALPYLRFGIVVIALFLVARLLLGLTLKAAGRIREVSGHALSARAVLGSAFPETGGEGMRRSGALIAPPGAPGFSSRALQMFGSTGWIGAHRFLFASIHLLGRPQIRLAES